MGMTDFRASQPANKYAWGHQAYEEFIEQFYFTGMLGKGDNVVEHITELSKNDKGIEGAWLHLIPQVRGGGIVGDNTAEGRLRSLQASWQLINFDQLRNGMETKGRVSEQKSILNNRRSFRKQTATFFADSYEDQAILTASGISYGLNTDGSTRVTPEGQDNWTDLLYASDVVPPSANRHFRWDATNGLEAGDTTQVVAADVPVYDIIPDIWAKARELRIPPLRINGQDHLVWLVHTSTMARLWKNADFRTIVKDADYRGKENAIFRNSFVAMNGLIIKPYERVFNTRGAATGSKWGAGGAVNGTRSLVLGTKALAMADLGPINWEEEDYDFKARWGLVGDKMAGFGKARFLDSRTNTVEDYSTMAVDLAL